MFETVNVCVIGSDQKAVGITDFELLAIDIDLFLLAVSQWKTGCYPPT